MPKANFLLKYIAKIALCFFLLFGANKAISNPVHPDTLSTLLQMAFERKAMRADTAIHPLRVIGERSMTDPYKEQNNTGIINKSEADLKKAAMDLVAAIPATIATDFKVYDYTAYSLIGRMKDPEKWNEWAFNAMDSIIRNNYKTQYYLLIGKEINPSDGKVKFRIKLSLPTVASTGNKGGGNRSSTPCNGLNFLTEQELSQLGAEILNKFIIENEKNANWAEKSPITSLKGLEETKKLTIAMIERCFSFANTYIMPSGQSIFISNIKTVILNSKYNRILYGWLADIIGTDNNKKEVCYKADIDESSRVFKGYKQYSIQNDKSEKDDGVYYAEVANASYLEAGDKDILYVEDATHCQINVYQKHEENKAKRPDNELLTQSGVAWPLMDFTSIKNIIFTSAEVKALNATYSRCSDISTLDDPFAQMLYKNITQRLANSSEELNLQAKDFVRNLGLERFSRRDFARDISKGEFKRFKKTMPNGTIVDMAILNEYFFDGKLLITAADFTEANLRLNKYSTAWVDLHTAFKARNYTQIETIVHNKLSCYNVNGKNWVVLSGMFSELDAIQRNWFIDAYISDNAIQNTYSSTGVGTTTVLTERYVEFTSNEKEGSVIACMLSHEDANKLDDYYKNNLPAQGRLVKLLNKLENTNYDLFLKTVSLLYSVWSKYKLEDPINDYENLTAKNRVFFYDSGWFDANLESLDLTNQKINIKNYFLNTENFGEVFKSLIIS